MKSRRTGGIAAIALLIAVAMFPGAALASWETYTLDGKLYGIREGNNAIMLNLTMKQALRTAKRINKAFRKDKGFVDPGSGPCHDPRPGVQC